MKLKNKNINKDSVALAKALNIPVSTKHCIEISKCLRYRSIIYAKEFLTQVSQLKKAVPFKQFERDVGHKKGMSSGRFPQKAAKEMLNLIKSVEANAQVKGLNTGHLKIIKLVANRASIPFSGGRRRRGTKRTNMEIGVSEGSSVAKASKEKEKKEIAKKEEKALPLQKNIEVVKPPVKTKASTSLPSDSHKVMEKVVSVVPPKNNVQAPVRKVSEPSSEELFKQAQARAAQLNQLNKKSKEKKEFEEVSNLYEELKKKGSLRK